MANPVRTYYFLHVPVISYIHALSHIYIDLQNMNKPIM